MRKNYEEFLKSFKEKKRANRKWIQSLKRVKPNRLDDAFHEAHDKVFERIDCLECANCCKTTGPLWTKKDIDRVSKHLRMHPADFEDEYLKIDEEGDHVLQTVPCAFLGSDNYCSIYEYRPKACAEYPHSNRRRQSQILNLTYENALICPAITQILDEIKKKLNT